MDCSAIPENASHQATWHDLQVRQGCSDTGSPALAPLQTALDCHTHQGLIWGGKAGRQQRKAKQHPSDCMHGALHATAGAFSAALCLTHPVTRNSALSAIW